MRQCAPVGLLSNERAEIAEHLVWPSQGRDHAVRGRADPKFGVTSIESGHLSVVSEWLYVDEIVSKSLEMQAPLITSASLELRVAIARYLPDIWADGNRILQVFENLIGNAIKFTKAGGQIMLGAEASKGEVVFSVSDTG